MNDEDTDKIADLRLFAGSSSDYTLNTECNEGQPVTSDGVINCGVMAADYIHIINISAS